MDEKRSNTGRRRFIKAIGSAGAVLGLVPLANAADIKGVDKGESLVGVNKVIGAGVPGFSQKGPVLLAPEYTVVDQLPPDKEKGYFMAPSLAKMPGGTLVAASSWGDYYPDGGRGLQKLIFYNSKDNGMTWKEVSRLPYDSCEPQLYVIDGKLYLIITPQHSNTRLDRSFFPRDNRWGIWACVSEDEGRTWSPIKRVLQSGESGRPQHAFGGQVATVIRDGKLYFTVSDIWQGLAAVTCQLDMGILNPDAWRISNVVELPNPVELSSRPHGSHVIFEGNVVSVGGRLLVIARTRLSGGETANIGALFEIFDEGNTMPLQFKFIQFYPIPGGRMKFFILYDEPSKLFWMASSPASNSMHLIKEGSWDNLDRGWDERRSLLLWYSVDSLNWFPAGWIAYARGWNQSFHYPVMFVDGNDIALISRTANNSGDRHDVDFITFHRIKDFRDLAMDMTPIP